MSFKDDVAADIKNVFLNEKEFAEQINFDGVIITAVPDLNDGRDPLLKETTSLGSFKWDRRYFIVMEDLPHKPEPGDIVRINNGDMQYVAKTDEEMGMYIVYLTGNES